MDQPNLDLCAPRPLTADETSILTAQLKSHLRLHNTACAIQAEADAEDLLNYACEMIDDGQPVGQLLEELDFMEMDICDDEVLDNIELSLVDFFIEMNKAPKKNWRETSYLHQKDEDRGGAGGGGSNGVSGGDASNFTNWREPVTREVKSDSAVGNGSYDYDYGGEDDNAAEEQAFHNWRDEEDRDQAGGGISRNGSINSGHGRTDSHSYEVQLLSSENYVPVDLSAKNSADKYNQELQNLRTGSLKDRMSIYNDQGELRGSVMKQQREELHGPSHNRQENASGKSNDELRRQELMAVMNDRSLSKTERAQKMDEVKAKYGATEVKQESRRGSMPALRGQSSIPNRLLDRSHSYTARDLTFREEAEDTADSSPAVGGVDLSAKAAAAKHAKEMASLFGGGTRKSIKDRMSMYDENGQIIKNSNRDDSEHDMNKKPKEKTNDQLRRDELMVVMKDKSLSKEEKKHKMEEIRLKYSISDAKPATAAGQPSSPIQRQNSYFRNNSSNSGASNGSVPRPESPPPPPNGVDLSAKAAADKNKREMESLFGNGAKGKGAMSSNRSNYERQLLLDKPGKRANGAHREMPGNSNGNSRRESKPNNVNTPQPPSLDVQRRAELQAIMKDSSLKKDERRRKMEEVKKKYAALANNGGGSIAKKNSNSDASASSLSSGHQGDVGNSTHVNIDLSAKSYANRPGRELGSTSIKSLSDRKSMYNNQSTIAAGRERKKEQQEDHKDKAALGSYSKHRTRLGVNVDPTSFALAENGLYGVYRDKKKSTRHEYGGRF